MDQQQPPWRSGLRLQALPYPAAHAHATAPARGPAPPGCFSSNRGPARWAATPPPVAPPLWLAPLPPSDLASSLGSASFLPAPPRPRPSLCSRPRLHPPNPLPHPVPPPSSQPRLCLPAPPPPAGPAPASRSRPLRAALEAPVYSTRLPVLSPLGSPRLLGCRCRSPS